MVKWEKRYVDSGDVRLAVFRLVTGDRATPGTRPAVVLVHGWPDSHHLWTQVAPLLAGAFDVYAYDTRGYGESDSPSGVEAYRLDHLARDLFAVIDAVGGGRQAHVIAHDWGSIQAWEAVTTPDAEARIASFVSVSGPNLDYADEWVREQWHPPTARKVRDYFVQQLHMGYTRLFRIPGLSDVLVPATMSPGRWTRFVALTERMDRSRVVVGPTFRRDVRSGLRYYRANLSRRRRPPNLRPTKIPVLELINTRDIALRPPLFAHTARHAAVHARRDSRTGHWLPLAHPEYLADCATEFIRTHSDLDGNPDVRAQA
ncbi:alpha/beta fold hydrolase [Gordonia sp. CPCC 205515]|uniref:alpha/beta fold hydrolase n=1 Tax=Gordonia sp. CPCC 205515 TaxID=3140791 RepID=UPI003AF400EA